MRKFGFIAFSAAAALALSMTTSCQKEIEQAPVPSSETSTVCFTLSEPDTKTAMGETVDNKVTNVWSSDDKNRMTFYQNGTASTAVTITSDDDYKHASFTATFAEATADSYTYKALLASNKVGDLPVVPAVQHPTASSFDPDANVLVGLETEAFAEKQASVNLIYKHAAAISRISFTDIPEGLKIYGVQINAASAIAGAAKSVNYVDGTVDYSDASENTISLIYDSAPSCSGGAFDAFFVTIPGTSVKITDIKLVTDKGTFVKTNSSSSTTTFDVSKFKTVKVAVPSTRTFYKATSVEADENYMIVSGTSHALKHKSSSSTSIEDQSVSVSNDIVTRNEDPSLYLWTASKSSDFTLENEDYYIKRNSTTINLGTSDGATFNYSNSELTTKGNSNTYRLYYSSGWKYNSSSNKVSLFTSKLPQALKYSSSAASYDIVKDAFVGSAPVLSGTLGPVSYTSSNTNVATVDSEGNVTVKSTSDGATATITATVAGNSLYQAASASYTLTVIDSNKKYYRKVSISDLSDLTSGQYLLYYASNKYLFDATASDKYRKSQDTPSNDKIAQTSELDKLLVTFEAGSNDDFYVHTKAGYLGRSSNNINFDSKAEFTITLSSGQISMKTGSYNLRYSSGFSYSTSSSAVKFDLFLLDGSKKPSRNLSFTEQAVQKDINDSDFTNTLTGIIDGTTVTYSSSKTDVATVDANGQVTLKGVAGTTTITASTLEDETYSACSASYTLTVTKKETYVKVTSEPNSWAGTYLILSSDDKKLFDYSNTTSGNSFHAASLTETITDNKIVSSDLAKYEVEIIAFDSSSDYEQPNKNGSGKYYWYEATPVTGWKVKVACESDTYIYSYGGDSPEIPVQAGIEQTSGRIYYNGFYFNDGEIKMISSRGTSGSAKYLGYHSSDGFYYNGSTSASTEPTERVHLYKKQ